MGVVIALWSPGASPGLVGFITPVGGRHWLGACVRIDHVVLCECMCVFVGSLQYVFYCSLQRWLRCVDEWEVLRGCKGCHGVWGMWLHMQLAAGQVCVLKTPVCTFK